MSEPQLAVTHAARAFTRDWFDGLRRQVFDERKPYALCAAETPHELFEALDIPVVTAEWWSGVVGAKRMAGKYLDWMKARGYHDGLAAYAGLGLSTLLADDVADPPWGGLPKPAILCAQLREDGTDPLYTTVAAHVGAPYFAIDVPNPSRFRPRWWELARDRWEDLYEPHRIDLLAAQYRRLIATLEDLSGKRLDLDRLRALLERVNEQEEYFDAARNVICEAAKCPVRVAEQMTNTMTAQWHRGGDWAVAHARAFRDEVTARAQAGVAACPNEKVRLMWIGVGLWQNTDFYTAFEQSHGAVFVRSMYLSLAADGYIKYGLTDPVRALAARYLNLGSQTHIPPWGSEWAAHEGLRHRCHGAVILVTPNLRQNTLGTNFQKLALEKVGIPVLELRADPNDNRSWREEEMRDQVRRFIERIA